MQLQQCKHRDARNPERTRRLEKQQTMHCLVKLICCWNEEEWQQGKVSGSCLFTRAIWEDSQYPSSACEMVPQTGTFWVLLIQPELCWLQLPRSSTAEGTDWQQDVLKELHTSPAARHLRSFQELQLPFPL